MSVFVVQRPRFRNPDRNYRWEDKYDLTPAEMFGDLIEIVEPDAQVGDMDRITQSMVRNLQNFSDDDFIICIGNPIMIGMAIAQAADVNEGRVKCLQWRMKDRAYLPIQIDMGWGSEA